MNPYENKDLKKFIDSIPQEVVDYNTQQQNEKNERAFKEFTDALQLGKCFLCNENMNSFVESSPCYHWFTHPSGIKKKFFKKYLENPIGFFHLDSYFRWLANSENPLVNINDLKEETSKNSYLETTYKYQNIEWAFSIGYTDKEGHPNAKVGETPHYHIQMKVDDRVFLKFNDFHIPFSDQDLFAMELFKQSERVKHGHYRGQGIGIIEDPDNLEIIDDYLTVSDNPETAPFNRETLITAPEGETISGELIVQAFEESKKTKQSVGKIMQRLLKGGTITSIISPGEGVPEMTKRSGKK